MLDAIIAVITKGEKVLLIQRAAGIRGGGWWMAEYAGGELALNAAEVSDARWLTVDEIRRLDGTFEGDREFYRKILPSLAS